MNAKRVSKPTDEAHPVDVLLNEVKSLPISEAAKEEFLRLLRRMAGERVYLKRSALVRPYRVRVARQLIDQGLTVAQAKTALVERAQVSRTNAYTLIAAAIEQRFQERQIDMFGGADNG